MKNFNQAPLPFQGQKRRFQTSFKEALRDFDHAKIVVDLFGGSGLLSHWAKQEPPNAIVVFNDFDDYSKRVRNIERTNALLAQFRIILKDAPIDKVIDKERKAALLLAVRAEQQAYGYVDYITISSSLLFSMNYATNFADLAMQTMYNCVRKNDYELAPDYLRGVDVIRADYREVFNMWESADDVVFLIDPPYLSTDCSTYSNYWKLDFYFKATTPPSSSMYKHERH